MYRTILQGLKDQKLSQDVYTIFDQIRSRELIPAIYNIVLETCLETFDLEKFKQVWGWLEKDPNCNANALSFKIALSMYISVVDIPSAEGVVKTMAGMAMQPTPQQYAQLIQISLDSRNYKSCLVFIGLLRKSKTTIDVSSILEPYLTELEGQVLKLGDAKEYSLVRDVYVELFKTRVPSEKVLVVVMVAYTKAKDLVGVVKVWNRLSKQYKPNSKSIKVLLEACSTLGHEKTALAIHNMIINEKLELDQECYRVLLGLLARHTDCERVPGVLIDVENAGLKLDVSMWKVLKEGIDGRRDGGRFKAMERVVQFVQECFPEMMMLED
jgi:hypothetical protein